MAAKPITGNGSLPNFKLNQAIIAVLVTSKNEGDPIKMKALEWSQHYILIFVTLKGS